jgi:hypothetical protein
MGCALYQIKQNRNVNHGLGVYFFSFQVIFSNQEHRKSKSCSHIMLCKSRISINLVHFSEHQEYKKQI